MGLRCLHRCARRRQATAERSTVASAEGGFAELDQVRGVRSYAVSELTRVGADAAW